MRFGFGPQQAVYSGSLHERNERLPGLLDDPRIKIAAFSIRQGTLLGVTVYVLLPCLMLFLGLVLPVKFTRMANIVVAFVYALTIAGSAVGECNYYILGSLIETALLVCIAYYAWTWPKATEPVAAPSNRPGTAAEFSPRQRSATRTTFPSDSSRPQRRPADVLSSA